MVTVDSKGRIVLPEEVRDRLRIGPGTEVSVREQDGRIVVEPEDDPEDIIADIERLVESASTDRPSPDVDDLFSKSHLDEIKRGAAGRGARNRES